MKLPIPERILQQHIATLGKTGSGKSSVNRVLVEHLLDRKKRTCVVDPKGDWWGLKSSADGKSAGYPVICFGDFKEPRATDVPINEYSGRHVAELIATGNRPCIIGFRGWMPAQLLRFWVGTKEQPGFAQALFNANDGELHVTIDEVHNFAPKGKIMDPDSGRSVHWTNRIMSEGRGLGMIFSVASQRPQKVHNDTLDCCETLIALRVTHPRSREATEEWINAKADPKLGKEVVSTLAALATGEGWVWSPDNEFGPERVQFPMFETFDSFAPPQLQKKVSQAGWSEVNLDQVREKLASVIAEAKANDPKELKAELARLKVELSKKTVAAAPAKSVTVVDEKAIERAVKTATAPLLRQIEQIRRQAKQTIENFAKAAAPLNAIANLPEQEIPVIPQTPARPEVRTVARVPVSTRALPASAPTNGDAEVSRAELRVLSRLAELVACTGSENVRKEQLAAWSELAPTSGGFRNYLGSLRTAGLIHYPGTGYVALTEAGKIAAQPGETPTTSHEMLERAKRVLGGTEARMLDTLHHHRDATPKETLAQQIGLEPTSGGFRNYLGHMRTLGFVEYPEPGTVKCADWLYL